MKRIILFSVCFLVIVCISLIAHTPASFALKYIPQVKGLKMEGPGGTIWQGELQNLQWQGDNFGYVSWNFEPWKLLQAKANFQVRFGRGSDMKLTGKGHVGAGITGLYAESLVASLPAEQVLQRMAVPVPLTVKGNIELSVNELVYAQPWCQSGKGTLAWSGSHITSPLGGLELGAVITDWVCEDNRLTAKGNHNDAQLTAGLDAELQKSGQYKVDSRFKPNAGFPETMRAQLKWLGDPNQNGEYLFSYSGKINMR